MSDHRRRLLPIIVVLGSLSCRDHVPSKTAYAANTPYQLYDAFTSGIRSRAVLVPRSDLTIQFAEVLGREFIADTRNAVFSELLIGMSESDLKASYVGTVPRPESQPSFDETLVQLKAITSTAGQPSMPVARVFTAQGSALLTYRVEGYGNRDRPGIQEVLLAGDRDPTIFELNERRFRLLKVSAESSSRPNFLNVVAFFKSGDELACQDCRELLGIMQKRTAAHTVEVQIRKDAWFASRWFPVFFRFEPDNQPVVYTDSGGRISPPRVWQYYRMPQVTCYWNAGAFSCQKYDRCEHVP